MATHDIIVIGASAGGVEAISTVVAGLPRDLRAAIEVIPAGAGQAGRSSIDRIAPEIVP